MNARLNAITVVLACGLLLAGALTWSAALFPALDGLTAAIPVALALTVLALVSWVSNARPRRLGMVVGASALVWSALVAPEVLRAFTQDTASRGLSLRLAQFNTFERNAEWSKARLEWLERVDPDVITLQEIATEDQALLAALEARFPHRVTCETPPYPCPVMILSRRAPSAIGHFSGGRTPQANVAWARFGEGSASFVVMSAHLDRPWPDRRQHVQLRRLAGQVKGLDQDTVVLAGDFNATSWSFALRRFERASGLARRTVAMATWPARPWAILPIDHVFAGRAWRVQSLERGPYLGSDHHPIVATLNRR